MVAALVPTAAVTRKLLPNFDTDAFVVMEADWVGVGVAVTGLLWVGVAVACVCVFVGVAVACWTLPAPPESVPPGARWRSFSPGTVRCTSRPPD